MNNPVLAPASASSSSASAGGLFGKPSTSVPSASAQSSTNPFAQSTSSSSGSSLFATSSTDLFGKPVPSSSNPFQSSSFGTISSGSDTKTSLFGKAVDTSSTAFKITFGSAGTDDAGTGRSVESKDSLEQTRQVIPKDPPTGESRPGSGLFGKVSPRKDDSKGQSARLFGKPSEHKKDLSKIFQQPKDSKSVSPLMRDTSPSRRSIESFEDPFGSDISDLETFGQGPAVKDEPRIERESLQGRSPVKRSGLFGKALVDVGGVRDRDTKRRRDEDIYSKGNEY